MRKGFVYILTNRYATTFYIGVTSDIQKRIRQHKAGEGSAFCAKYRLKYIVYLEEHFSIKDAIAREKQLKAWRRDWKIQLVAELNPRWVDLFTEEQVLYNREDPESSSG